MITTPKISNRAASVDEVLALVAAQVRPLAAETVPLAEASGRVLRETIHAPEDQPVFDRSSVDGYGVRLDDESTRFRIVDCIRAGEWKPRQLERGQAVQIATGGALPSEGLQVVMQEAVRVADAEIVILQREATRNIRFRGEDAKAGAALVPAGTILSPGALALLANVGWVQPRVTRRPRVLHIATGDEIVPPDRTPQRGQIRDSNSTLVQAFLEQWRIVPRQQLVGEDPAAACRIIVDQFATVPPPDLLLFSGGASVGERDFCQRLLRDCGFTVHVSRTTARPGRPLIFATRGHTAAFGLPGNPLAHFVCLNLYVRVALEVFGEYPAGPVFSCGVLAQAVQAGDDPHESLWPARVRLANRGAELTPLAWHSSGDLTSLALANALVRIPAGSGTLSSGTVVEFAATGPFT